MMPLLQLYMYVSPSLTTVQPFCVLQLDLKDLEISKIITFLLSNGTGKTEVRVQGPYSEHSRLINACSQTSLSQC